MKYWGEVQDLMQAFPGRKFRVAELCRYVKIQTHACKDDVKKAHAVRIQVRRMLGDLVNEGLIRHEPSVKRGGYALYWWPAD